MSQAYSITFSNNSSQVGMACLYQKDPGLNVISLAWMTWLAMPNTSVGFNWTIDYSFFWSQAAVLMPGVQVYPDQVVPAGLPDSNSITLSGGPPDNFEFGSPQQGPQPGLFYINTDTGPCSVSAGIGISGAVALAIVPQPEVPNIFTPQSSYWLTFGNYQAGDVLDAYNLDKSVEISFPANVYDMRVTFNADGSFTVDQGR